MSLTSLRGGLCLIITCFSVLVASESILPNGDFQTSDANGAPTGWTGDWKQHRMQVVDGHQVLRMSSNNSKGNTALSRSIPVDKDWLRLRFSMKVRVEALTPGKESWQNFRFNHILSDAAGQQVGGYDGIPSVTQAGEAWQEVSAERDVPKGTASLVLSPGFYFATGIVDVSELRVEVVKKRLPPGDAEANAELKPHWDQTPVIDLSPTRSEMVLNDCWQFMPARGERPADLGWGLFQIPGSWKESGWPPVTSAEYRIGTGPQWSIEGGLGDESKMWFRRTVAIPAAWAGRRCELALPLVSTDARIFLDGSMVGSVSWPGGTVDLTAAIRPGATQVLDILVVAVADSALVAHYMDANDVTLAPAKLTAKGILSDVVLTAMPPAQRIEGVFVQTSVRQGRVDLMIETVGLADAQTSSVAARMIGADGRIARRFQGTISPKQGSARIGWDWPDAHFWDIEDPYQYRLELDLITADGKIADTFIQRFGFREFHIDGKDFYLNNQRLRLRPILGNLASPMLPEQAEQAIDDIQAGGFTFRQFWPGDPMARGSNVLEEQRVFAEVASRKGLMISGIAPDLKRILRDGDISDADRVDVAENWKVIQRWLRNEPSLVMWGSSGNFFAYQEDQDPLLIGRSDHGRYNPQSQKRADQGTELITVMKAVDPTRPIFTHHGGSVGDVHTVNMYLCFIPLQERIEWLERYRAAGNMPFMPVEFGTPLHTTWHRGRNGFGKTVISEPLVSEFVARDFGREAYAMERPQYRAMIRSKFKEGQTYGGMHGDIDSEPGLTAQVAEYNLLTWQTWRTWGITGGMIPWVNGHGWDRGAGADDLVDLPPYVPGERGYHAHHIKAGLLHRLSPPGGVLNDAGRALLKGNQPTLAWIGGRDGDAEVDRQGFTDRSHLYRAGSTLTKQLVFLNDTRKIQPVSYTWRVEIAGQVVAQGKDRFDLESANDRLISITAKMPAADKRSEGEVILEASIGAATHVDRFAFRVYPQEKRPGGNIAVVDAVGETTAMLQKLGYTVSTWDAKPGQGLVVIGRRQLSSHGLVAALQAHVEGGGHAIVMAQDPEWMRLAWGLRVARHQSRQVFVVDADHPLCAGLDERDLKLWTGQSQLQEARPDYLHGANFLKAPSGQPYAGWHWGNRHSISSAAIEKPHHSGWRPILECEFDLAYSPLLELDRGAGKLILCTLDLEDHAPVDPVAEVLTHRLLRYAASAPVAPRRATSLLGSDDDAALLASMGLEFTRAKALPGDGLVIIGAEIPEPAGLRDFLARGGRVLALARHAEAGLLGTRLRQRDDACGSLDDPTWPEMAGISPSDLRWRSEHTAWIFTDGCELAADGFVGRIREGKGIAILLQSDPRQLPADVSTYFRFSRWRQTRLLAQVLSNLGASFGNDTSIFTESSHGRIDLAAVPWQARQTLILEPSASPNKPHKDPGITAAARAAIAEPATAEGWQTVQLPSPMEELGATWASKDGEAIFRCQVELTAEQVSEDYELCLGKIDDFDTTFVNGVEVGSTDRRTEDFWNVERNYRVPAKLLRVGTNSITIRVFDHFGGGGVYGGGKDFALRPVPQAGAVSFYHADYRDDFALGDDPFRYYRW